METTLRLLFVSVSLLGAGCHAVPVLEPGHKITKVAGGMKFTEGPAFDPEGRYLVFSDIHNDRIMRLGQDGKLDVLLEPSGNANGLVFDAARRLIICQGGIGKVSRLEKNGSLTVLAETYGGARFIAPNDLCIDQKGRIYFTDPDYGPPERKTQPTAGVYRIDAPRKVTLVVSDLERPNGIAITPDNRHVYVSDRMTQKLHRFAVEPDGSLEPEGVIHDFSPGRGIDGMCLDAHGNIYAGMGKDEASGLFVLTPDGDKLLHLPMPEFTTNCTFGGADGRTLYITATTGVYSVRALNEGIVWPAGYTGIPD